MAPQSDVKNRHSVSARDHDGKARLWPVYMGMNKLRWWAGQPSILASAFFAPICLSSSRLSALPDLPPRARLTALLSAQARCFGGRLLPASVPSCCRLHTHQARTRPRSSLQRSYSLLPSSQPCAAATSMTLISCVPRDHIHCHT